MQETDIIGGANPNREIYDNGGGEFTDLKNVQKKAAFLCFSERSEGGKDRYTVLSKKVHKELQDYYRQCYPKVYLFNGRQKGQPMSAEGLRHALNAAVKRSGIKKEVNLHILRHCFASHALEDGMNIKTLQHLLGHSSIHTTLIYLHVSDIPLRSAFSPLDNMDE